MNAALRVVQKLGGHSTLVYTDIITLLEEFCKSHMGAIKQKEKFLTLQKKYTSELPLIIGQISSAWKNLLAKHEDTRSREQIILLLHNLVGSGTTFGYPEITQTSRELEQLLKKTVRVSLLPEITDQVERLLFSLQSASLLEPKNGAINSVVNLQGNGEHQNDSPCLVYLLDAEGSTDLEKQLGYYGYELKSFTTARETRQAIQAQMPGCFIIKTSSDHDESFKQAKQLKELGGNSIPLIIIAKESTTKMRLLAVRAGSNAFFDEPLRAIQLIDSLDQLTEKGGHKPYRIMIVDDSEATAGFYAMSLQNVGMQTQVVTNPLETMSYIVGFEPDLILMDLYMPNCSGGELAELIRQQEGYVGTPIVFLSAETSKEVQIEAMSYGGDEFLTKPVRVRHLVSVVKARVQRFRQVKALIVRDSLTGLYNHTHIKELLQREVELSKRNNKPMQFAMIDIDHFKQVNDNHGHPTGDCVIKILSRLLKQSLRSTDIVGRYGGEEFAAILPNTSEHEAEQVLNKVREQFSKIAVSSEHGDVKCTFSAGIAGYPTLTNSTDITQAADEALYFSKNHGRNLVSLSGSQTLSSAEK